MSTYVEIQIAYGREWQGGLMHGRGSRCWKELLEKHNCPQMIEVHREYEGEWQGGLTHWRGSLWWWWQKNMYVCIYILRVLRYVVNMREICKED